MNLRTHKRRACAGMTRRIEIAKHGMTKRPGLRAWISWEVSRRFSSGAFRWQPCYCTQSYV